LRIAATPDEIHQVRIDNASADALIGGDIVVSSSPKASATYRAGMRAIVNMAEMPTGDIVRIRDADLATRRRLKEIERVAGAEHVRALDANALAERLFGDAVFANIVLLGFAWQQGLVPVGLKALERAIVLNGVAIERNRQAFAAGRLAAADPSEFAPQRPDFEVEVLEDVIARRARFLTDYQNAAWTARYRAIVDRVRTAEKYYDSEVLTDAVARSLFKLMSYKDEYEVARLHMQTGFLDELKRTFDGDFKVNYHFAPPLMGGQMDARGRPLKRQFGQWIQTPLRLMARFKGLRGTAFDVFSYTAERKMERELIGWYEGVIEEMLRRLGKQNPAQLLDIAKAPMDIRGYGPVKEVAVAKVKARVDTLLHETPVVTCKAA
jgi:indolepyruvate ferredoxin oxidoreductase